MHAHLLIMNQILEMLTWKTNVLSVFSPLLYPSLLIFSCILFFYIWDPCISLFIQYIPRNMHTVFALLCFVVVIHWLTFPYPSALLHWHCGNLTIAPVPAKQPWWIWINTSCEFIMNDCITTTKQSRTKPCAYFLGYTVLWKPAIKTIIIIIYYHYNGAMSFLH